MTSSLPEAPRHVLECRAVSFMSTFSPAKSWIGHLLRPPLVAQFLSSVSLVAHTGELHGVVGVAGSGKSTLLDVISSRAHGDCTGNVLLDRRLLTPTRFARIAAFVSFRARYVGVCLPLRSLLFYQTRLTRADISSADADRWIVSLLRAFDLSSYSSLPLSALSESARRRALLALHLVDEPLIVVVDDVVRDLDPLPAFQLLSCLSSWVKQHHSIALISMRMPRSDIYQLLHRITILYYGEVFYSGLTKQLPAFFRNAGFPCPVAENPAGYYLSLATVDRETAERYGETHDQAARLVEHFRLHTLAKEADYSIEVCSSSEDYVAAALSSRPRPSIIRALFILIRRSLSLCLVRWRLLLTRVLLAPSLLSLIFSIAIFTPDPDSSTTPFSVAGTLHMAVLTTSSLTAIHAIIEFLPLRSLSSMEHSSSLNNSSLPLAAHLTVSMPLDAISTALFTMLWLAGPFSSAWQVSRSPPPPPPSPAIFYAFPLLLLASLFSHLFALAVLVLVRSSFVAMSLTLAVLFALSTAGGGFLKSASSSASTSLLSTLPSYANIFHFTWHGLHRLLVPAWSAERKERGGRNCSRDERQPVDRTSLPLFCRWNSSTSYLSEMFPDDLDELSSPQATLFLPVQDTLIAFGIVMALLILTVALFAAPKPRAITDKFRYG